MVNGTVIASDVPENIRSNPDVQVAYLGEAH
jgi:ABC-type branched-subunit amino acid transport system ATPase component